MGTHNHNSGDHDPTALPAVVVDGGLSNRADESMALIAQRVEVVARVSGLSEAVAALWRALGDERDGAVVIACDASRVAELAAALPCDAVTGRRPSLTPREQQVLTLMADGLSNREISMQLGMAEQSAKNHVSSLLRKLHAPNRTAAAASARRIGLLH